MQGKTVGIIGFGNTGSALASLLSSFSLKILAYDKFLKQHKFKSSLKQIYKDADIISLHIPYNEENKYFINESFINNCNFYGFVGAPIKMWYIPWQNGGLSLRKKSLMIKAIKDKKENESFWPEDRYFTVVKKEIVNPAPFFVANKFSVEKFYYNKPFGIHKCWEYLKEDEFKSLVSFNEEIKKLIVFS